MGGWPIRWRDNCWQVGVGDAERDSHIVWIRCESDSDAQQMSASLELMGVVLDEDRVGDEAARELEAAAALFTKYGHDKQAARIIEHANFARGLPSLLDN